MAPLNKETEDRFNRAAAGYLAGHGRNFLRSMNPRNTEPLEKVQPWGEARAAALNPTQSAGTAQAGVPGQVPQALQPSPVAKQPEVPVLGNQSKVAVAGGAPAAQPAAGQQQQAFRSLLGNGITVEGDVQGNRVATMGGGFGVDGGGTITTRGGQQAHMPAGQQGVNLGAVARQNLQGRGQVGGYSFEGGGADFAKFAQQPTRPALQDGNTVASQQAAYLGVRDRHEASKAAQANLAGLDPRSGWGWKGRQDLYKHQQGLDQRDREVGTRAVMDAAQMQQDQQQAADALAQNQQQFDAGQQGRDVDVQAKQAELGFNRQKQAVLDRLNASTDPDERRALTSQLLAMQGKDPVQKYQVVTREGIDPVTQLPTKTPYAVNQDDPSQSFEIRGQGRQQPDAMGVINGNQAYAKAYSAASPEQQAEMLKKVRERLAQKGGL